jgi:hypothetical protein
MDLASTSRDTAESQHIGAQIAGKRIVIPPEVQAGITSAVGDATTRAIASLATTYHYDRRTSRYSDHRRATRAAGLTSLLSEALTRDMQSSYRKIVTSSPGDLAALSFEPRIAAAHCSSPSKCTVIYFATIRLGGQIMTCSGEVQATHEESRRSRYQLSLGGSGAAGWLAWSTNVPKPSPG